MRLALGVGQQLERGLHAVALEAEPRRLLRAAGGAGDLAIRLVQRVGAPALLASDEVDGAAVHEREDPGARLRPVGRIRGRGAPDAEKALLDGVLGEPVVAHDAVGQTVGDATDAVVQLRQRPFVAARDEGDERLIGQVRLILPHRPRSGRARR